MFTTETRFKGPLISIIHLDMQEDKNNDASTVKFEGMNIRPNLFPTLQKIWSKHGNIVENSLISNGDNIARLLESLASSNYDTHP